MSCDNEATRGFGPLLPGHLKVDFGDTLALEKIFKEKGEHIAGFLFEPIQGEAGVIIPPDGYLNSIRDLCSKYNILMIADEVQTGIGRTGKMLACDWEDVRPDVVVFLYIYFIERVSLQYFEIIWLPELLTTVNSYPISSHI